MSFLCNCIYSASRCLRRVTAIKLLSVFKSFNSSLPGSFGNFPQLPVFEQTRNFYLNADFITSSWVSFSASYTAIMTKLKQIKIPLTVPKCFLIRLGLWFDVFVRSFKNSKSLIEIEMLKLRLVPRLRTTALSVIKRFQGTQKYPADAFRIIQSA